MHDCINVGICLHKCALCMCVPACMLLYGPVYVCSHTCVRGICISPHPLPSLSQNFLNAGSFPEIQGFLQLRGSGRKLWKRFYCFLRRSGLYYSTKGTSKVRR